MKLQGIKNAAFLLLIGMAAPVLAQPNGGRPEGGPGRSITSPEDNARRISTEMKEALGLTDEQSEKMCALYLEAQQALVPPQGIQPGNFSQEDMAERMKEMKQKLEEANKQLDEKMKELLGDELYERWSALETERWEKESPMPMGGQRPGPQGKPGNGQ